MQFALYYRTLVFCAIKIKRWHLVETCWHESLKCIHRKILVTRMRNDTSLASWFTMNSTYLAAGQLAEVRFEVLSYHWIDGHQAEHTGFPHAALRVVVTLFRQKNTTYRSAVLHNKHIYAWMWRLCVIKQMTDNYDTARLILSSSKWTVTYLSCMLPVSVLVQSRAAG